MENITSSENIKEPVTRIQVPNLKPIRELPLHRDLRELLDDDQRHPQAGL